jgi:hypothetical protein
MVSPIRHDARTVSARDWRAAREGETHAAGRRSNTPESFIVAVGASGGLLAGAAIVFVTLVGVVSFNVWPSGAGISSSGGNVELGAATPPPVGDGGAAAPLSSASGQLASATPPARGSGGGGAGGAGGGDRGGDRDRGSAGGQLGAGSPPSTTPATPPTSGGGSDEGPQPGTGEPISGGGSYKAPNGRSVREKLPVNVPGQTEHPDNGKGYNGDDNGKDKGRPGHAGKGVAALVPPVPGSDEQSDSNDNDNDRSSGRDSDGGESSSRSSRSSSRSSRGSSESPGRGKGRGRSDD